MRPAYLGAVVWSVAAAASAQERAAPAREVTVEQVTEFARGRAARTLAARSEARVAEAEVAAAAVYPNPTVSYGVYGRVQGQSDAINGSQHQAWLEQPVLLGHDGRRREAARGAADARRAEAEAFAFEVAVEARRRFVALLAAQETAALLRAARAELGGVLDLVRGRADAGAQSAYDVARVEMEAAQLDSRVAGAEADVQERSAALAAWLGVAGWSPVARGPFPSEAPPPSLDRLWAAALARSSALVAARRRVAAASLDVRRAERERWPVPTLGVGAYLTTDGASASLYGSLSVPVPLWDSGGAQVRRAEAGRLAAEAVERAVEAELRARLEGAVRVVEARQAALAGHDGRVMAGLVRLREMADASYRSGATRVFDLLDAFRARLAAREQRVELVERLEQARVEVDAAAGFLDPAP
ncbi:MAG: TolC family protein [Polyangiales bacterium]